ncbi:ABC transporter substrate-binding protein [Paenibacillus sp. YYML68]|uniref:ABC transporter substrate-binding protein n=1 Tax=Paenibacillus sp. YYML68 TaxID=2909250 RepID=UPI00249180FE|nr:ABC transporter substrate-binding protein [Paenibacillus sp. YYML68]
MKRAYSLTMMTVTAVSLLLSGCVGTSGTETSGSSNGQAAPRTLLQANWKEIAAQAKGQTVQLYMWGGSDSINTYIDEWVAPRLKQEADVTLRRVPMNDTKDIVNKLLTEKQAGKAEGTIDIMWMNGENFKTAKENGLLFGSFASKLPNAVTYTDLNAPDIANDFGLPTEGMEAPWGKAQFVFIYDSAKLSEPPRSMDALLGWAKSNPGKFAYPAPPDFTGSAFIRHALYETTGGHQPYMGKLERSELEARLGPLWTYLNELEPLLWREGKTYPENLAKLDQLFTSGEVWMSMSYDPSRASNLIEKGAFPSSTRTFMLDGGTLSNTHYLAIPYNAPSAAGAMAAINYMLSPEAQLAKYDPKHWGEDMALDPAKLPPEDQRKLSAIDRGPATLPAAELASRRLPELPSDYVELIEKGWTEHVAKK